MSWAMSPWVLCRGSIAKCLLWTMPSPFFICTWCLRAASPRRTSRQYQLHNDRLRNTSGEYAKLYEMTYGHNTANRDNFEMRPGFSSLQTVQRGTYLANSNRKKIYARKRSILFLPMYHINGENGFFLILKIPRVPNGSSFFTIGNLYRTMRGRKPHL